MQKTLNKHKIHPLLESFKTFLRFNLLSYYKLELNSVDISNSLLLNYVSKVS